MGTTVTQNLRDLNLGPDEETNITDEEADMTVIPDEARTDAEGSRTTRSSQKACSSNIV